MKSYPEYRDSGIDWLGKIPEHWQVLRNLAIFSDRSDRGYSHLPPFAVTQKDGVLPQEYSSDQIVRSSSRTENSKRICKGDIVYNKMRMWQGAVGIAPAEGRVSTAYVVCQPIQDLIPRFFEFLYRTPLYMAQSLRYSYGGCKDQYCLYPKDFKNIYTIFPPKEEQTQIANFLDNKTQRIDELIRAKERKIELLGEYRASLINQAVTKGLDPNAEMKPSGVEWIGEIPNNWQVKSLKYIARGGLTNGLFKKKHQFGSGTKLINVSDIYQDDFYVKFDTLNRVQTEPREVETYAAKAGDIFFVRSSLKLEGIAASVCIAEVPEPTVFECHLVRLHPCPTQVLPRYLINYLNCYDVRQRLISLANTVTMTTIAQPKLASIEVILPPLPEQRIIVDFLDSKTKQIDELRSNEEQTKKLLKEYRQSLISAAVTGKIDVRDEV